MGETEQKERELRQVNISTGTVTATSQSLNVSSFKLEQTEDLSDGIIVSPVMKRVDELPLNIPDTAPTEDEVIQAHEEVDLKLAHNSVKHPRRVKRAKEKRDIQRNLLEKRKKAQPLLPDPTINAFDYLNDLKIEDIMHDKSGNTSYSKVIKNIDHVKVIMLYLPDFANTIQTRKKELEDNGQPVTEELLKAEARLDVLYDIRAYYSIYERLIMNKYFAMLPHVEMHKLSYNELRLRLKKLYEAPQRNQELIDYYQDLVRLKELGLEDGTSTGEREEEYYEKLKKADGREDTRDPKEELGRMADAYNEFLEEKKQKKTILSVNAAAAREKTIFRLCGPDIDKFRTGIKEPKGKIKEFLEAYDAYKNAVHQDAEDDLRNLLVDKKPDDENILKKDDGQPLAGIRLSEAQKEGVRKIGAYILGKSGKDAFKYRLLETRPEQQLLVFYLVENDKQDSARGVDFFRALENYEPDLERFKDKENWKKISRALRASFAPETEMERYGALAAEIEAADAAVEEDRRKEAAKTKEKTAADDTKTKEKTDTDDTKNEDKKDTADTGAEENKEDEAARTEERIKNLVKSVALRGVLLKMLYRNAGLHEDMPPDMAEDPVLRAKMFNEYREIGRLVAELKEIGSQVQATYESDKLRGDTEAGPSDKESTGILDISLDVLGYINDYFSGTLMSGLGNLAGTTGFFTETVTESLAYAHASGWGGSLTAVLGFAGAVLTSLSIATEHTISGADRTAQALSVSADYINSASGLMSAATTLVGVFTTVSDTATTTMQALGGAAVGIAGTIQIGASSLQLARGISTKKDISRSRKTLATKDQEHLTADEKRLKRFLDHESRESTRGMVSAGVGIASGVLAVTSGVLIGAGCLPAAAAVGLVSIALTLGAKFGNWIWKRKNRKKMVDDMLGLDDLVKHALDRHSDKERLKKMDKDDLRDKLREESLAMLGFTSYKDCYRHICVEYATLLYNKVFVENPAPADRNMYLDAMKSLGLKMVESPVQGEMGRPTIDAMVSKLMSG